MAVIQDEQGNNKPIKTDTSHVFDVNGNPLHGELFIGETIASDDVEAIDGYAHESDIAELSQSLAKCPQNIKASADISIPYSGNTYARQTYMLSLDIDFSKVTPYSYFEYGGNIYRCIAYSSTKAVFNYTSVASSFLSITFNVEANNNTVKKCQGTTSIAVSDIGSTNGDAVMNFYY